MYQWHKVNMSGCFVHWLPIGVDGYAMRVQRLDDGRYCLTAYAENVGMGNVCFLPRLYDAKRAAEALALNGQWVDLAQNLDHALQAIAKKMKRIH